MTSSWGNHAKLGSHIRRSPTARGNRPSVPIYPGVDDSKVKRRSTPSDVKAATVKVDTDSHSMDTYAYPRETPLTEQSGFVARLLIAIGLVLFFSFMIALTFTLSSLIMALGRLASSLWILGEVFRPT
ncbi:hypothetical protein F5Y09DRAFT_337534 [Xylaria sp. FL1042]|nr:hypothetical protein F5Y09DRAFT_337534 [Xylaria sp. FL1042]